MSGARDTYGFSCGYCRETLETPFVDATPAEDFADALGWRYTYGHTDAWGGNAHVTCPCCASVALDRIHIGSGRADSAVIASALAARAEPQP